MPATKNALEVFTRKGVDEKTAQKLVENGYTFTKVARATEKIKRELEKMLGEKKLKQLLDSVKAKERMPRKKKDLSDSSEICSSIGAVGAQAA